MPVSSRRQNPPPASPLLTRIRQEQERRAIDAAREAQAREGRLSLRSYAQQAWHVLEPGTEFVPTWSFDAICDHLQGVTDGHILRLLINVPPGFSKSLATGVFWPTWEWGPRDMPWLRYFTTSWSLDYAARDSRKARDLIQSEWYGSIWNNFYLTRAGERSYENNFRGTREAKSFVSLTSGRGDRVLIDDPHSTEKAESDAERDRARRIARESLPSRVNSAKSAIVCIMQRLHENDVSAELLASAYGYTHLRLPMEYEADNPCRVMIGGKLFFKDPRKKEGELLAPERYDRNWVETMKHDMQSFAWNGQYQQRPGPRGGALFKREWFEVVGAAPAGGVDVRGWDLAGTKVKDRTKQDPSWTVGIRMRRSPDGVYYIMGEVRLREESLGVEKAILATASQDGLGVQIVLPQDPGQAGKDQRRRYAAALAGHDVRFEIPTADKASRAAGFEAQCEAGNVKLVAGPWNDDYLTELCGFPTARYNDRVDATATAFNRIAPARVANDERTAAPVSVPL